MKRILTILAILVYVAASGQSDNPSLYVKYPFSYGTRIDRTWADKALHVPRDTIYTKSGLAIKGSVLYYGDSTKWYPASGSGSGEVNTASNLGGGLANYSTKVGADLRFNSFSSADFKLNSNLFTVDTGRFSTRWRNQHSIDSLAGVFGIDNVLAVNQTLTANRTIATNTFGLTISGSAPAGDLLTVQSGNSSNAANFISNGGIAFTAQTSTTTAFWGITTQSAAGLLQSSYTSTSTIEDILRLKRTTGTATDGIGGSIVFEVEATGGGTYNANRLQSVWSNATFGSRTSQFNITGVNSTADETYANFQTGGIVRVNNLADTLGTRKWVRDNFSSGSSGGAGGVVYLELPLDPKNDSTARIVRNGINDTLIRQSAGLSVIARASNSTGNVADLTASVASTYLRLNSTGTALEWGALPTGATLTPLGQYKTSFVGRNDTKGLTPGLYILMDSSSTNITVRTDSSAVLQAARASAMLRSIGTGIKLAVDETRFVKAVVAGYGQLADSTSNANAVTLKSDTATLGPYFRSTISIPAAAPTLTHYGNIYTDSGWVAGDITTDFTLVGGATLTDSSGYLLLDGGAVNFTRYAGIKVNQAAPLSTGVANREHWRAKIELIIRRLGVIPFGVKSTVVNNTNADLYGYLNTTTGQSHLVDNSATNLTVSVGDKIEMIVERDGFNTFLSVRNITTGSAPIETRSRLQLPTGNTPPVSGYFALFAHSGRVAIKTIRLTSNDEMYSGVLFLGDSKTAGKNGDVFTGYTRRLQNNFIVVNYAGISETTADWLTVVNDIISLHPKQIVMTPPSNDLRFGVNTDSTINRYNRMELAFRAAGIPVYHIDGIYETNASNAAWATHIYATKSVDSILYVYAASSINGFLDADNIHPTAVGQEIIYKTIMREGKLKYAFNSAVGPDNFVRNQPSTLTNQASQLGAINITGFPSTIANALNIGSGAAGEIPANIRVATDQYWKLYGASGNMFISALNGASTVFQPFYLQGSLMNLNVSGITGLALSNTGAATFANTVALGSTSGSGTFQLNVTGATNQVLGVAYNGTALGMYMTNAAKTAGVAGFWEASSHIFRTLTSGGSVIDGVDISTAGALHLPLLTASLPLKLNSSKEATAAAIDLTGSEVTGNLPIGNIVTSTNRDNTHFLRGDGTWQTVLTSNPTLQQVITASGTLTASGTNTVDVNSGTLNINNANILSLGAIGGAIQTKIEVSGTPADYARTYMSINGSTPTFSFEATRASGIISTIVVTPDSLTINPHLGKLNIDTLRSGYIDTTNYKPLARKASGDIVQMNSWAQVSGGGGGGSGITVGTTTITSGTSTRVPFNDAGVYNEDAGLTYAKATDALTVAGLVTTPLVIGGTTTTSPLTFKTTSGVGTTNADMIFQVGNNGATEAMRITNAGFLGINTTTPLSYVDVLWASGSINADFRKRGIASEYYGVGPNYGKGGVAIIANGTRASPTGVNVADLATLLTPVFYDGTQWHLGATISSSVTAVTNNTSVASELLFFTGTVTGDATSGATTGFTQQAVIDKVGNMGIGVTSPTAVLHLKAGTAAASTAPLKFTSGTNLTTAAAGAMEFDGSNLYFTPTGTIRKTIPTNIVSRSVAQTAAVATVATQTVGASDASYEVSANVLVTTATAHSFTVTVAYTDEGNTARTLTLNFSTLAGVVSNAAITNAGGAVPYEGVPLHIRAKAATTITVATTGTFTTVTYNVEGRITQMN